MKKLYLLLLFVSISFVSAFAQTMPYTDDNGATWTFVRSSVWNSETQQSDYYWSLKSVKNYGDEITVPATVTYNEVEYPVEAVGENVFRDNKSVSKIILPSSIKRIDYCAFYGCSSLKDVGDISNCEYIAGQAFYGCISLTSIDLSSCKRLDGYGVFNGCQSLTTVGSLSNIEYIGSSVFYNCKSLKEIDLPAGITIENSAFCNCTGLSKIGSLDKTSIGENAFNNCTSLKNVDLSTATKIGPYAFYQCTSLESVGDLSAITGLDNGVFNYCRSLKNVTLSSCKVIGSQVFCECSSLSTVTLGSCLTIGDNSFSGTSIQSIDLTTVNTIGSNVFSGCKQLKTVSGFGHFTTVPDYLFNNCSSLENIDISQCKTIGNNAFFGCKNLISVQIPVCETIGSQAFMNCTSIETLDLPLLKAIPNGSYGYWYDENNNYIYGYQGCFAGCTALKDVKIPSCKVVGSGAFNNCSKLASIGNLAACDSIKASAFFGCNKLGDVIVESTSLEFVGNSAFNHTGKVTFMSTTPATIENGAFGQYILIMVPAAALTTYQAANGWNDIQERIFAIGDKFDYVETVTARDNASGILEAIGEVNLRKVFNLKLTGTINSYDIMVLRDKTINLHHLDLSDVSVVACPSYVYVKFENGNDYYTKNDSIGPRSFYQQDNLLTVKLPKTIKYVDREAFRECHYLESIEMYEGIEGIGDYAFYQCNRLKEVVLPNGLKALGYEAFAECNNLEKIVLPNGLERIEGYAFSGCYSLKDVRFPSTLESIGYSAFRNCSSLPTISLPTSIITIDTEAFAYCNNLKELNIPSSVKTIRERAFDGCSQLIDVYTYTVQPTVINQNTFVSYDKANLHIPKFEESRKQYYYAPAWSQFRSHLPFDEPYKYFYLDSDYTLNEDRIDGNPDADVNSGGSLTVEGEDNQNIDDLTVIGDGDTGQSGSVIADDNINANWMKIKIKVVPNKWYFFGFPFRILLSNIEFDKEDVNYVFRYYDGAARAENGNGGWKNLPAGTEALERGVGYIFQCNKAANLILKVEKPDFTAENVEQTLEEHESAQAQNAGWNFIGNPHISYYDINDTEYSAPITIWNGTSYEAIRPIDDDYFFHPFQGFFVQKPDNKDKVKFNKDDRTSYLQSQKKNKAAQARRMTRGIDQERLLIELTIADTEARDKTRIVFNEKATTGYETLCDAAKFMSTEDVPQIYTLDNEGAKYAINERPAGEVKVGYLAKTAGTYKIAAIRMDKNVTLYDDVTKTEFDFTNGDYTFESEAGTFDNRFTLKIPTGASTGLAEIKSQTGVNVMGNADGIQISNVGDAMVDIYSLAGVQLATGVRDGFVKLPKATYIVKVNNISTKVMVK